MAIAVDEVHLVEKWYDHAPTQFIHAIYYGAI